MGELHLGIIIDRMEKEFKVEANVGAPQVAYKFQCYHRLNDYTHKKQVVELVNSQELSLQLNL